MHVCEYLGHKAAPVAAGDDLLLPPRAGKHARLWGTLLLLLLLLQQACYGSGQACLLLQQGVGSLSPPTGTCMH